MIPSIISLTLPFGYDRLYMLAKKCHLTTEYIFRRQYNERNSEMV